jgi:hypothetical protein
MSSNVALVILLAALSFIWLISLAVLNTVRPGLSVIEIIKRQRSTSYDFDSSSIRKIKIQAHRVSNATSRPWGESLVTIYSVAFSLKEIGFRLAKSNGLQIERFVGSGLMQIADDIEHIVAAEDNEEAISRFSWQLSTLVDSINNKSVQQTITSIANLLHIAHWPKVGGIPLTIPLKGAELYPRFIKEFMEVFKPGLTNLAFRHFVERWKNISIKYDTFLFFLIRILDIFRGPLIHIEFAQSSSDVQIHRIQRWVNQYVRALGNSDMLGLYEYISLLVNEFQMLTIFDPSRPYLVSQARQDTIAKRENVPTYVSKINPLQECFTPAPVAILLHNNQ